ncbi:hypothetical protein CLF_100309 [Clonorchis sinensis]|uniref:Uncharacterized protein n=1 Tax=Clonorchis sinensis TaxID=79923 RepID=G7Y360_CLOSI|nr:hypothetical protein CLF_100309 [Clonorchis sinensis]
MRNRCKSEIRQWNIRKQATILDLARKNRNVLFKYMRHRRRNKPSAFSLRDRNGEPTSDPIVVSEFYRDHYAGLYSVPASSSHPTLSRRTYDRPLTDLVFTVEDIRQLLHKINPFCALGPDEVHPRILKEKSYTLATHFQSTKLFPSPRTTITSTAGNTLMPHRPSRMAISQVALFAAYSRAAEFLQSLFVNQLDEVTFTVFRFLGFHFNGIAFHWGLVPYYTFLIYTFLITNGMSTYRSVVYAFVESKQFAPMRELVGLFMHTDSHEVHNCSAARIQEDSLTLRPTGFALPANGLCMHTLGWSILVAINNRLKNAVSPEKPGLALRYTGACHTEGAPARRLARDGLWHACILPLTPPEILVSDGPFDKAMWLLCIHLFSVFIDQSFSSAGSVHLPSQDDKLPARCRPQYPYLRTDICRQKHPLATRSDKLLDVYIWRTDIFLTEKLFRMWLQLTFCSLMFGYADFDCRSFMRVVHRDGRHVIVSYKMRIFHDLQKSGVR